MCPRTQKTVQWSEISILFTPFKHLLTRVMILTQMALFKPTLTIPLAGLQGGQRSKHTICHLEKVVWRTCIHQNKFQGT